jgi:hypothetical protein
MCVYFNLILIVLLIIGIQLLPFACYKLYLLEVTLMQNWIKVLLLLLTGSLQVVPQINA